MITGEPKLEEIRRVTGERDRLSRHIELLHGVPHRVQPVSGDPVDSSCSAALQADETLARSSNSDPYVQSVRQGAGVAGFLSRSRHRRLRQSNLLRGTSPGEFVLAKRTRIDKCLGISPLSRRYRGVG